MATLSSKAAADSFLIADYNAVIQALREILGITDDGQAYIDLGDDHQLRLDNSSTLVKVLNSQLYFEDTNQGAWPLSALGGTNLQDELLYGYPGYGLLGGDLAADWGVANQIYLYPIYVAKTITVDHFVVWDGIAGLDAICGVYNTSGTLLASTGSFTQTVDNAMKRVALPELILTTGTYWIAYVPDGAAAGLDGVSFGLMKVVAAGSFTLPASIVIPGTFSAATGPIFCLGIKGSPIFS